MHYVSVGHFVPCIVTHMHNEDALYVRVCPVLYEQQVSWCSVDRGCTSMMTLAPVLIQVLSFVWCRTLSLIGACQSVVTPYLVREKCMCIWPTLSARRTTHATINYAMRPSIDRPVFPNTFFSPKGWTYIRKAQQYIPRLHCRPRKKWKLQISPPRSSPHNLRELLQWPLPPRPTTMPETALPPLRQGAP